MTTRTEQFKELQLNKNTPDIHPGDTVKVHQKIKEGDLLPKSSTGARSKSSGQIKERVQVFEGLVIAKKHGKGISATITVRKVIEGVGVERIFPVHSPSIVKIEIMRSGKVRRAKLYYLRQAKGKKSRLKKQEFTQAIAEQKPEETNESIESENILEPSA